MMNYYSLLIVVLSSLLLAYKMAPRFFVDPSKALVLYFWHSLFSVVYYLYVQKNGGDALGYYAGGFSDNFSINCVDNLYTGTCFIELLTYVLTELGFSFLGCFIVFQFFGFLGLVALDGSLKQATENASHRVKLCAALIVFLPSMSFWSSALGKDSLSFMAVCFSVWASISLKQRWPLMVFSIVVMFFVRPHIASIMLYALLPFSFFYKENELSSRIIMSGMLLVTAIMMSLFSLNFLGFDFETFSFGTAYDYVEARQTSNMGGGASLVITDMSLAGLIFTYLFRPLPYEFHHIPSFFASIDNLILLILFVYCFLSLFKIKRSSFRINSFLILYSLTTLLLLSYTTANLGISVRQKWMVLPPLIYLVFYILSVSEKEGFKFKIFNLK